MGTNGERTTPDDLFRPLDRIFDFQLDAAATAENAKCARFFTREQSAFLRDWGVGPAFCNPPYDAGGLLGWCDLMARWGHSMIVVGVLPGDTSTRWFQKIWDTAQIVWFPPRRYKFNGLATSAKFASAIPIWGPLQASRRRQYADKLMGNGGKAILL